MYRLTGACFLSGGMVCTICWDMVKYVAGPAEYSLAVVLLTLYSYRGEPAAEKSPLTMRLVPACLVVRYRVISVLVDGSLNAGARLLDWPATSNSSMLVMPLLGFNNRLVVSFVMMALSVRT